MQNTVKIEVTTWLLYTLANDIIFFFSLNRLKFAKKRLRTPDKIKIYRSRNVSPRRRSAEMLTTRRVRSAKRMSSFCFIFVSINASTYLYMYTYGYYIIDIE